MQHRRPRRWSLIAAVAARSDRQTAASSVETDKIRGRAVGAHNRRVQLTILCKKVAGVVAYHSFSDKGAVVDGLRRRRATEPNELLYLTIRCPEYLTLDAKPISKMVPLWKWVGSGDRGVGSSWWRFQREN